MSSKLKNCSKRNSRNNSSSVIRNWKRRVPRERKIGGKHWIYGEHAATKKVAKGKARNIRKMGGVNARVIKVKKGYDIFVISR